MSEACPATGTGTTFIRRYWLWDSRAEGWMLHERKCRSILQYRLAPLPRDGTACPKVGITRTRQKPPTIEHES